jgi:hypothetical protein
MLRESETTEWTSASISVVGPRLDDAELRKLSGRAGDKEWNDQASATIDYARRSGWIDAATGAIRAHIERV